ncbi:HTH-type transcriptional regulator DegA [Paenibacillus sp. CCS19]|uniref:LacI family DNA-binding transcriptional regulator n=1 Tax=Paenibacillus sp. CCS19 TaxID=3158387 RepID=UPI002563A4F5|nr:LacI family DNA-binding transcriptional regulator [Paenibacillus cellulosilyticus]GMK42581.1 HTH-type transcriptional regulator DegA [Paenibacillus cellulosilyticus]
MKTTIYDIAQAAGVSIATVSNVLNGKGKVSQERRQQILRIMDELNYKPSAIASALTSKRTYTLGLLVPDISNPFFAEIARAVEDEGQRLGYSVLICSTDNKDEKTARYSALLRQKSVDGVIIGTGINELSALSPLLKKNIPVAFIARDYPAEDIPSVIIDDYAGGAAAAVHLIELGHRRLAILAEPDTISSSRERVRGFRETAAAAGVEIEDALIVAASELRDGKQQAALLLSSEGTGRPSAIFCCNDLLAIGALQAARELHVDVPQHCSIVGFDDTILASVTDPALTTVAQPIAQMGQAVVQLLVDHMERPDEPRRRIVLPPRLIVRQSTVPPSQ